MYKYTVLRIKEYTDENIPANSDDIELDKPMVFDYVDKVSKEQIYADYLRYFRLPDTTDVIIMVHPEISTHERTTNSLLLNAIGKTTTQGALDKLSKLLGHRIIYILNMPEFMCEKIIPQRFNVIKNVHEVEVWVPAQ